MGGHVSGRDGETIADRKTENSVGRGEKHLVQIEGRTIQRDVEEDDQKHGNPNINSGQANEPATFPLLHFRNEQERQQAEERNDPTKRASQAKAEVQHLIEEPSGIGKNVNVVGAFILAAAEGVKETFHRTGITPLHWRASHARQGFIKIEGNASGPDNPHDDNGQDLRKYRLGHDRQPATHDN